MTLAVFLAKFCGYRNVSLHPVISTGRSVKRFPVEEIRFQMFGMAIDKPTSKYCITIHVLLFACNYIFQNVL